MKTVYTPSPKAKEIYAYVAASDKPLSFGMIAAGVGKIGTATVKALVDNGYLAVAKVEDVVCPCCGARKKDVKFYAATDKAIA